MIAGAKQHPVLFPLLALLAFGAAHGIALAQPGGSEQPGRDVQEAALAPQSPAERCTGLIDETIGDPFRAVNACTALLGAQNLSDADRAAAHIVRARARVMLDEPGKARNDNLEAVKLYTSLLGIGREPYPPWVFLRGAAYHALGEADRAVADYTWVIQRNPRNFHALMDRAIVLSRMKGETITALADFDQAIAILPQNFTAIAARGETHEMAGQHAKALADYTRAIELAPQNTRFHVRRGALQSRLGAKDLALKDYATALALDPENVEALANRGALYAGAGDSAAAIADLDRAIARAPHDAMALYNRGYARFAQRDWEGALEDYTAAIVEAPRFGLAYNNRCLSSALLKREKTSTLRDCDRALQAFPERGDVRETRALAHLLYGDFDAAIADYDAALKIEAARPLALYGRGLAKIKKGQVTEGRADQTAARALFAEVDGQFTAYGLVK